MSTDQLLDALPAIAEQLELELVNATRRGGRNRGKPDSRLPMSIELASDLVDAWTVLTTWSRDWCDTYGLAGPRNATWDAVATWLAGQYRTTAASHPALDEFDDEIGHRHHRNTEQPDQSCYADPAKPGRLTCPIETGIYWRLSAHLHVGGSDWRGTQLTCPLDVDDKTCGGKLRLNTAERVITCRACGTTWTEDGWEHLGKVLGCQAVPVTLKLAADWTGIPLRTLRHWASTGILPATRHDIQGWLVDVRDVNTLATRTGA